LKHRQSPHGAKALSHWIEAVEEGFAGRILPIDHEMMRVWGDLAPDRSKPVLDTLLAATAIARNMTLVTRNVSDFQGLPLNLLNPWAESYDLSVSQKLSSQP
jgi:predicted nucleic acid-binding protein